MLEASQLERSLAEHNLGVLIDIKLNMSQQYALVAKRDNCMPIYISLSIAISLREVSLYLALMRPRLEYRVQFWAPRSKRNMKLLEKAQWKFMKMTKWNEHLFYEKKLRQVGLLS